MVDVGPADRLNLIAELSMPIVFVELHRYDQIYGSGKFPNSRNTEFLILNELLNKF